jgi:hypothetical protein
VCTNNDTRIATFVIEKKSSFLLVLNHIGCGFYELQHVYSMHAMPIEIIDFFENLNSNCINFDFYVRNKWIYGTKILSNQASTKSDVYIVYNFGVLLIRLVNGSPLTLDGNEIHIRNFIQWVREVHEEEDGIQQNFDVAINNSIIEFDRIESKLFFQISVQCIKVNFVANVLFYHSICGQEIFKKPKIMDLM